MPNYDFNELPKKSLRFGNVFPDSGSLIIMFINFLWFSVISLSFYVTLLCGFDLIYRCIQTIDEHINYHDHYEHNSRISSFTFNYTTKSLTVLIICVVSCFLIFMGISDPLNLIASYGRMLNLGMFFLSYCFTRWINITRSRFEGVLFIRDYEGLDIGSGMAYSYFFGYLNILLPNRGDDSKGVKERIEDYEDQNNVTVPVKKLFILISDSMYFPPDFTKDSKILKTANSLQEVQQDRAGVRKRSYKNSVYQISKPGETTMYVVAEGASILLTFYESIKTVGSDELNKMKREIVLKFYKTLKNICRNSRECRHQCIIVYYHDPDDEDQILDIGEILSEAIKKELKNN